MQHNPKMISSTMESTETGPVPNPEQTRNELAGERSILSEATDPRRGQSDATIGRDIDSESAPKGGALSVDVFGLRPLCFRVDRGRLETASRADSLADGSSELDAQAIFNYLYFHTIPSPRTIFKDIRRVPAGHQLLVGSAEVATRACWAPVFDPHRDGVSLAELKRQFRRLLSASVAGQLDGGKPGCFLSGGTDSSTVAGMIKQVCGRVATYSIGFDASGYDEMAFARVAARHFGTEHHEYYVTPEDLITAIPSVAGHYDQPFGNSSAVPAYYCARMARDDGVTRILAGDGGDELFGGNSRYATQKIFGLFDALPEIAQNALAATFCNALVEQVPLLRKGGSYIRQARVPMPDRLQTYNMLDRLGAENVFERDFLATVDREDPIKQQREVWRIAAAGDSLNRHLAFDWRYTLAENDVPKVCGTAELAGIQVGFPLLDSTLLEFSLKLPVEYKLKGLKLRWFFKEALRGFLPDEIINKRKHGFGLPFGVWAAQHPVLNAFARDALRSLGTRGVIRASFIDEVLDHRLLEHPGYYGEMIWILMMLEHWLRKHRPTFRFGG